MSCAPAFSAVARAAQSFAGAPLCCRQWCRSVAPQSPPSLAAPVPFCGGVIVWPSVKRGCRPGGLRLKGLYARPASSGCGGSCRAKKPRVTRSRLASFRCPPRSGVVMQRQTPVRQRCHRAPFRRLRTLCRPHPQTPRRGPAMPPCRRWRPGGPPSRVAGNGLSGKRNDRFVAVVIW